MHCTLKTFEVMGCTSFCSYTLSKFNDAGSSETNASICGFTKNVNEILRLTGNDSSARLVNLTLNITHIFPKPKICPSDGIWNATANCTILRTAACPNSTFLSKFSSLSNNNSRTKSQILLAFNNLW